MGRLKQVVIDCDKPSSLARFWAAALDEFDVRAYDDEEIARLAALGFTPGDGPGRHRGRSAPRDLLPEGRP
jgi:hypothetical protein